MKKAPTARDVRIGVVLTAVLLFVPVVLTALNNGLLRGVDFAVPYTGGVILRQGNAAKLYDLAEQQRVQQEFLKRPGLLLDPYPPFHAPLFALLTRLGYRDAYLVWGVVNILLWLAFYRLLRDEAGASMNPFRYLKLASLFFPLWVAMFQGQFSVLLLVAFALAFLCLKRGKDWAGGLALGLGLLKFQVVIPFALIFLLRGKWKFIAGLAVAGAVLGVVSLAVVGQSGLVSYVNLLIDTMRHPSNAAYATIKPWNMATVRGLLAGVLRGSISQQWISVLGAILSSCLILAAAWGWRQGKVGGDQPSFNLLFAVAVAVSVVASPYLQPHDLTPILLAVISVVASPEWMARSKERAVIRVVIAMLYASPLYLAVLVKREKLFLVAPVLVALALAALFLGRRKDVGQSVRGEVAPGYESLASAIATDNTI